MLAENSLAFPVDRLENAMRTTTPRRFVAALLFAVTHTACHGGTKPLDPTSTQTSSGTTVTGVVLEYAADGVGGPVANLRLKVTAGSASDSAVGGTALPDVVTDADGRYVIANVRGILFLATA